MGEIHTNSTSGLKYTRHLSRLRCLSLRGLAIEQDDGRKNQLFTPESDLELRAVNLFSGPNGSGKTTILDAVRSLFEPAMLARLRRENIQHGVISGMRAVFNSGSQVVARFHQNGEVRDALRSRAWNWQKTTLYVDVVDVNGVRHCYSAFGDLPVVGSVDEIYLQPFQNVLSKLGRVGRAWPPDAPSPLSVEDYVRILGQFQRFFPCNEHDDVGDDFEYPGKPGDLIIINGHLHQYHGDDLAQSNLLSLEYLPSGWQQVVELLAWVERSDDHSICVIDEPERHLHPTLQRALISELSSLRRRKDLQLIIATHSSTFLNRRAWGDADVSLFHLSHGRVVVEPELDRIIEQLGCLASDLCQSNGVIWVEGASDRIYIKAFLRAWRATHRPGQRPRNEKVDYSFAFFGGSCLSHYTGTSTFDLSDNDDPAAELIELLSLNRNLAICMDRDNDFVFDDFGSLTPINASGRTKARVAFELATAGRPVIHVTHDYTMECYVADVMPEGFLELSKGRVQVAGNKVQQATRFSLLPDADIYSCVERHRTLREFIEKLDAAIDQWGHYYA